MAEDKEKKLTMEELENVAGGGFYIDDPRYEEWKNNHQVEETYVGKFEVGSLSDLLNKKGIE